jgi:hypothetical protein
MSSLPSLLRFLKPVFTSRQSMLIGSIVLLSACTSPLPAPTEQMAVSTAAVAQAVSAGATELAPIEMRAARDKLDRAQVCMAAKDYAQALILAEQAQVDAQLAVTKARSSKAQSAASALREDSRILRDEINRSTK